MAQEVSTQASAVHRPIAGYIVEFYTYTDGWRQARAGYLWKSERTAEAYRAKWVADQASAFAWNPDTRVSTLVYDNGAVRAQEQAA